MAYLSATGGLALELHWAWASALAAGGVACAALAWRLLALRAINRRLEDKVAERSSKLHAFAVELIRAEEEQRSRIARELHDGLGQMMTAVNIELQVLRDAAPDALRPRVDDVRALSAQVMNEMRRISHELRPAILDEMGLAEAVRALVQRMGRHGVRIELVIVTPEGPEGEGEASLDRLPADSVITCYRLVQEALNNVVRHSEAQQARVELTMDRVSHRLAVVVTDDGRGIDYDPATAPDGHFGLLGLQERIHAIGGMFSVGKAGTGGTRVCAELPV
jgi:two-component system, NarL family, sensor histidine kinase UhpB